MTGQRQSRLRILHVIQNLNYGGMERVLADLVERLDPDQFEIHVLTLQYLGRFSQGLERHATLHVAPPQPRWSLLWPRGLSDLIRSIGPDVVHSHSGVWLKTVRAARMARVPWLIHTEHGRTLPDPWISRTVDGLAARRTDVVVAVSEPLAAHLRNRVIGRGPHLAVVPNGIDTSRFAPRADRGGVRKELGLPGDVPVIGSIGRLETIKGYDVVVRAFATLAGDSSVGSPHLVLAGDGRERPALESLIREFAISGRVHLLGWRDDPEALLATFSLFTMGSRSEGTSISLLEAMSSGLCPVVTAVGGNPMVLGPSLAHRLVPSEDPSALAAGWRDALQDPAARQADAARARARVATDYGVEAMVAAYRRLYTRDVESR